MVEKSDKWKYMDDADFKALNLLAVHDEHYTIPLYNQACGIYNVRLNDGVKGSLRDMCVGAGAYLAASLYRGVSLEKEV